MHFCNLDDPLCCSHNMDDAFWSFGNLDVALCICAVVVIQKIISGVDVKNDDAMCIGIYGHAVHMKWYRMQMVNYMLHVKL